MKKITKCGTFLTAFGRKTAKCRRKQIRLRRVHMRINAHMPRGLLLCSNPLDYFQPIGTQLILSDINVCNDTVK